jgi:peptidoglycan/LPS O-acetylase OafA/YrhL
MNFVSLQALRAVAAIGVMLFHLLPFESKYLQGATIVPAWFHAGRASVDLFFVLSGFLTVWTTRQAVGLGAAQRFLLRRLTRIYPTYWVYCVPLVLAWVAAPGGLFYAGRPDLLASLLLIPNPAPPLLLVAWTLEFEIYFYVVFALLICTGLPRRRLVMLLVAWGVVVACGHVALAPDRAHALLAALLSPLVFEFLAGCAAAFLCAAGLPRMVSGAAGVAGCGVLTVSLLWSETLFALPWVRVAAFGGGTALLLIGCFGEDRMMRLVLPGLLVRIGDASYSLYLSHLFTIGAIGHVLRWLPRWPGLLAAPWFHAAVLAGAVAAALLVAELSYRWIECPLLRLSRVLVGPPARAAQTAPAA